MATFYYKNLKELEPRPGYRYATVYYKQTPEEYRKITKWLCEIAEQMLAVAEQDPMMAEWMIRPQADFKKSTRSDFYTVQELITDLVGQVAAGKDLPRAMISRWNRLTENTPWQIELVQGTAGENSTDPGYRAEVFEW